MFDIIIKKKLGGVLLNDVGVGRLPLFFWHFALACGQLSRNWGERGAFFCAPEKGCLRPVRWRRTDAHEAGENHNIHPASFLLPSLP